MAVQFRPMMAEDYRNLGYQVSANASVNSFENLADVDYFSNFSSESDITRDLSKAHMRKYIQLNAPVFNFVLGRSHCYLLQKMLGIDKKTWDGIVDGNLIMDKLTEELVPIDEAMSDCNYLYGAEIADLWITQLDIEEAKLDCLYSAFSDLIKDTENPHDVCVIDRNQGADGVHITSGYYLRLLPGAEAALKRGRSFNDAKETMLNILFKNNDQRFTYLMNMDPNKTGLRGMLNYYIAIVPENMRPKVDRGEHKLTNRYTKVIKANFEYMAIKSDYAAPKDIRAKYLVLQSAVSKLQYKNVDLGLADTKKDDLSILERIKTKKGQIRMHNLGKRQDYSGRAVVCINPFLPVDYIKVPVDMLPKLLEYHLLPTLCKKLDENKEDQLTNDEHQRNIYDRIKLTDLGDKYTQEQLLKLIQEEHLLQKIPVVMGRQPTLHKQSIQGFHMLPTQSHAIEVSPLVVTAYNMDFDGDQAWAEVPLSDEAIEEVNNLLLTTQNIYLAKTGSSTIEPRQDMLYGLYMCTRKGHVVGQKMSPLVFNSLKEVRKAVIDQMVEVDETVVVPEYPKQILAGDAAIMACFADGDMLPRDDSKQGKMSIIEITNKTICNYVAYLLRTDALGNKIYPIGSGYDKPSTFVGAINHLVELGFRVAENYSSSMTLDVDESGIVDRAIDAFHEDMSDASYYYGIGMETSDNYKIEFDNALKHLEDATSIADHPELLDVTSGYNLLSVSGARGSKDNLKQAFIYKGRVKKNSSESFDAIITNSYASQLTPREQHINAFGGRQGQIDKSLKTGDTGYAMRKMWHCTQGVQIVSKDCCTKEGLKISKKFLVQLVDVPDVEGEEAERIINKEVSRIFKHAIVGRFKVGASRVITEQEAEEWANDPSIDTVEIRSILHCKDSCCQRCYGIDPTLHKIVPIGTAAGILAAQSIGEPGSQLTLKQFQSGGVSGKAEFTSAFDKVNSYITVSDLKVASKKGTYTGYDPLAWATGKVNSSPTSDINMKRVYIDGASGSTVIPKNVVLKEFVTKGEGLSYKHGDYSLRELVSICGIETAQTYLIFKLFNLYKNEVEITMAHFEVLAACMTRYMITSTDRNDLLVGQYCTAQELHAGDLSNTEYRAALISVDDLPQCSLDGLDAVIMENQSKGLSRACLLQLTDNLFKPLNRMVLGKTITSGSAIYGFTEARKERIH